MGAPTTWLAAPEGWVGSTSSDVMSSRPCFADTHHLSSSLLRRPLPRLQAIRDLLQSKTGKAPLMSWVFPKQEAVAVLMPDMDSAVAAL